MEEEEGIEPGIHFGEFRGKENRKRADACTPAHEPHVAVRQFKYTVQPYRRPSHLFLASLLPTPLVLALLVKPVSADAPTPIHYVIYIHARGQQRQLPYPALYLYPLNDSFVPKHIALSHGQHLKIGRQMNAKTALGERNEYLDGKVSSRKRAAVWEEGRNVSFLDSYFRVSRGVIRPCSSLPSASAVSCCLSVSDTATAVTVAVMNYYHFRPITMALRLQTILFNASL
ncbi:hypothetical protein NMY22_g3032 [Coprinellus aureogranulatus]|nr:hypothetical protein NMY22_g3032 [Coprinellus aureogranulatus]